jgi:DNA-binding transcriptional regulator YiaG
MENLAHQDWKTIKINTKQKSKKNSDTVNVNKNSSVLKKNGNLDDKIEKGELSHKKFDNKFRTDFVKVRTSLNLTQKQIATALNVPVQLISDLEQGKLNYDNNLNNKIKRKYKI